jgi:PleD family two-component response regulator
VEGTLSSCRGTPARDGRQDLSAQKMSYVHRVLLADDHALVHQGLRAILDGFQDVSTVGEASNGIEAVAMVDACLPDVILMHVNMPKMPGRRQRFAPPIASSGLQTDELRR